MAQTEDSVLVLVLRRDYTSFSPEELERLCETFPDQEIHISRVDPVDYIEHAQLCDELEPAVVFLPRERPIPSLAMEHGFSHVTFGPDGSLVELQPMNPSFKPFTLRQ